MTNLPAPDPRRGLGAVRGARSNVGGTPPGDRWPIGTFEFPCAACGIPIAADTASTGARVACPTCGSAATVPAGPPPVREPVRPPERADAPVPPPEVPDWVPPFWLRAVGVVLFALVAWCCGCCLSSRRL